VDIFLDATSYPSAVLVYFFQNKRKKLPDTTQTQDIFLSDIEFCEYSLLEI